MFSYFKVVLKLFVHVNIARLVIELFLTQITSSISAYFVEREHTFASLIFVTYQNSRRQYVSYSLFVPIKNKFMILIPYSVQ